MEEGGFFATNGREDPLQVRSMGTARSGDAAAALDGALYVVGGLDGTRIAKNAVEQVYNPITNRWRILPKMNTPR